MSNIDNKYVSIDVLIRSALLWEEEQLKIPDINIDEILNSVYNQAEKDEENKYGTNSG